MRYAVFFNLISGTQQSIANQPALLWRLLRAVEKGARIEVNIWLPRMRIEFGTRLNSVLAELGAASVFSSDADLNGLLCKCSVLKSESE